MSLHYDSDICQNIETLHSTEFASSRDDKSPHLIPAQDEPRKVSFEDRARYLRSGARIISFDERSRTVLCAQRDEWSVWLLDADGEPIRGRYFKSLRAAAFVYADRVMGYDTGISDFAPSGLEE